MVMGAIVPGAVKEGEYLLTYEEAVAFRSIEGHDPIDKFGANLTVVSGTTPVDVWEGQSEYINSTSNDIVSIISTDPSDNQQIDLLCQLLDGTEFLQSATLNGTARVPITPCSECFRMENEGATDIAGIVYAYVGVGGVPILANQRAIITNGNNQTQMAIYRIPKGKVGYLKRGELGIQFTGNAGAGTQFLRGAYKSRRLGGVFKVKKPVSLVNLGGSIYQDKRTFMDIIPALTDIKISVDEVSDNMGVWASFDIVLVDEDKVPVSLLQKIKQPGFF